MLLKELYRGILYWVYVWYFPNHWLTSLLLSSNITDGTVFKGRKLTGNEIERIWKIVRVQDHTWDNDAYNSTCYTF